jgi:hypothetical protein
MSMTPWRNQRCTNGNAPNDQGSAGSSLEQKITQSFSWSSRVFEFSDCQVARVDGTGKESTFLLSYKLESLEEENSGNYLTPVPPIQFSLKADGREIPLLTGLLGRHCQILEFKHHRLVSQAELMNEIQVLREENANLRHEVQNLYGALGSIQRPRVTS